MRKDVKFGLTIGTFLVVTLVVYMIVLSQGGTKAPNNPDVKVVAGGNGDPAANVTPTPLEPAPNHIESAGTHDNNTIDTHDAGTTDTHLASGNPTTAPSGAVRQPDWNDVLQRGTLALDNTGPDHTMTPMTGDGSAGHPRVDTIGGHPLIDAPAATVQNPLRMDVVSPGTGSGILAITPPTGHGDSAIALVGPGPATQPTAVVAGGVRTHKVANGETLSIISKAVYGNAKYWDKILAANPNINPKNLKIGTTLVIPDLKTVTAVSAATGSDHGADLPTPSEASAAAASNIDPTTTYVVVSGDSLEKISIKLYGKPQMKENLYQANKGVIGDDEDVLKIGMVLKLPSAPTTGVATPAGVTTLPPVSGTGTTASR